MATNTFSPAQIKTGPGVIRYAVLGTAIPTVAAAASKLTATWAAGWVDVGGTDNGLGYTEGTTTEEVRIAESVYPVKTNTTGKTGRIAFVMSQVSDTNWQLAMNGGTITVSGTGATKLSSYLPPLIGAERRVMMSFQSLDDEEIIVWPQVFNVGSVETARPALGAEKHGLPVEFGVELPDTAVLTRPYQRWTAGALAASV
jgi:hypothetical protein